MKGAEGAFLTGTAVEIQAIGTVDDQPFQLPWEKSLGALLQAQFHQHVRAKPVHFKKIQAA